MFSPIHKRLCPQYKRTIQGVAHCLGAHENGKELGLLLLEREWNDSLRIWDVLVWKEYRRTGVGTELMNTAK
ncbi:GNAT family N-acetyltransferase [Mesotoga sp.]|uniref:GNAT family N-acetyltransferase n=1 Tax=Mesotoga sp. TaxID=2053577 RepID=UPI003457A0DA